MHSPHLDGDVTSVSSGSILITDPDGFTRTINLSESTTYGDGISQPIEVGERIHAEGTVDSDGTSLLATVITAAPQPPAPPADGSLPAPPAPPADGSLPEPPTDGSLPAPPADGSLPAPPADGSLPTPPADGTQPTPPAPPSDGTQPTPATDSPAPSESVTPTS